jgi:hypothetical protein
MQSRWTIARSLALITLASVLFIVAPANRATTVTLPVPSPTPARTSEVKRPNPVRKFFSSVFNGITGVFRRPKPFVCGLGPLINLTSSSSSVTVCPVAQHSTNPSCSSSGEVTLTAEASDVQNNEVLFTWSVTAGRLRGEGRNVTWDLSGVAAGTYTATVDFNDGNQRTSTVSTSVTVVACPDCLPRKLTFHHPKTLNSSDLIWRVNARE